MNTPAEIIEQLFRKVLSEVSDISLTKFKDEYCSSLKVTHSSSYVRTVITSFDSLIKFAGDIPLTKIDSRLIDKFIVNTFNRSKYAAALYYRTLKAAFSKAVIWNYIPSNQFMKVKLPKFQKTKPAYLEYNQLKQVLVFIPEHLKDIYLILFLTGMRAGELTNLKWSGVDLRNKTIVIGDETFTTKSKQIRTIPICDNAVQILLKRLPKIYNKKGNYVFPKESGYRYTVDYLSKRFKKAVLKSKLNDSFHLHSLRHSFASNLIMQGVSLYEIKELLGHRDISTTQIYSHLQLKTLQTAVNKLNEIAEGY